MNKEEIKPIVEQDISFHWRCPEKECFSRNDAEWDGDGIKTPLKCEDCGKEFEDYTKDF